MDTIAKRAAELTGLINTWKAEAISTHFNYFETETGNLHLKEAGVILFLGTRGPSRMRDLAGSLNIALSTMTSIIDKLVTMEYVARRRSEKDRRVVMVALTKNGEQFYTWLNEQSVKFYKNMLEGLDENEQETLLRLFRKIVGNVRKIT